MKIEKNIPCPEARMGRKPKYPFADMAVGDSVFFDNEPAGSMSLPAASAHNHGMRLGKKFSSRKDGRGVRIWRVE